MNFQDAMRYTLPEDGEIRIAVSVISLSSASERRSTTSAMLNGQGLPWSFFDAHTSVGCEGLHYDDGTARRCFGRALTLPEKACYSSHYAVWKAFLEQGQSDYLLVLEDDLIIDLDFPLPRFAAFCRVFGIDYVRLFGKHFAPAARLGFFFDRSLVRFTTSPAGTQAYLLSVEGARRLVESCRSLDMAIDLAMDRFWETGLPLYSIFPYPVIERFVPTQIPIPDTGVRLSKGERWDYNFRRSINKIQKIRANRKMVGADARMRSAVPCFHQIVGGVER